MHKLKIPFFVLISTNIGDWSLVWCDCEITNYNTWKKFIMYIALVVIMIEERLR